MTGITSKQAIMHLISKAVEKAGQGAGMLGKGTAAGLGKMGQGVGSGAPKAQALLQKLSTKAGQNPKTTGGLMAAGLGGTTAAMMMGGQDDENVDEEYLELLDKLEEKQKQLSQRQMGL